MTPASQPDPVPDPLTQAVTAAACELVRVLVGEAFGPADDVVCGWWVGPVWKTGGETCVCTEPPGHDLPHRCTCGAWFEGCGHPPVLPARPDPRGTDGRH